MKKRKFSTRTNKGKMAYIRDNAIKYFLYFALAYFLFHLVMAVINFVK